MNLILTLVGAFLVGAIPFAFVVGRLLGHDLRTVGSGNVGATNLARTAGFRWGVVAFFLDAGKGVAPWLVAAALFPGTGWLPVTAGGAAVLGHCFSPFLGFRGGKGVATAAGVLGVEEPLLAVTLLLIWAVALGALRNVGIASTIAAISAMVSGVVLVLRAPDAPVWTAQAPVAILLVAVGLLVVLRHRRNIVDYLRPPPKQETTS